MKYEQLLIVLFLCLSLFAYGQCPTDSPLNFGTQQEIDSFIVNYPNCTEFQGDIKIDNAWADTIDNLNGLQNLNMVNGSFRISDCYHLVNLTGLENLTTVGGHLSIYRNFDLENLAALANVTSVGGSVFIIENYDLENLNGLESLQSVGEDFRIRANDLLTDLTGLESLTTTGGDLQIQQNYGLQSLSGLDSLATVGGEMEVSGNDGLLNFSGLNSLTTIAGTMAIRHNYGLENFNGLESLTSIGDYLILISNLGLQSVDGIENLTFIGGRLQITNHPVLEHLEGFESLTTLNRTLEIGNNEMLQNLSGFENLTTLNEGLDISQNPSLSSLTGLENLISISEHIGIVGNPMLTHCAISSICDYLIAFSGSDAYIFLNGSGCGDIDEVLFYCENVGKISYPIYYDLNQNAIQDSGEPFLPSGSVLIEPGGFVAYGNPDNGGSKYIDFGNYTVSLNENVLPGWELTSGTTSYTTTLDQANNCDTLPFGLYPTQYNSKIYTGCSNNLPRCNEFVTFEALAINGGSSNANGTLWLEIDLSVLSIDYIDMPDTLDGNNRLGWHFENLYPGHTLKKAISLQLPGPPDFPIGGTLTFGTQTNYEDENGFHSTALSTHLVEVGCSFGPNDKLVAPVYPDNYALIDENLFYTIRFQNTGNAEAYNVMITDELDPNLDLSTFQFISSSHESLLSTYLEGNVLTFEFLDIFLPDSTTNFDESQGYVMYSIRALDTLSDFSTIENTANIFFDLNPAVVTNTTENIMVETFDADEDGFELWLDCDDNNALVNVGEEEPYNGLDDDCNEATLDDDLDQDGFVNAEDCDDENPLVNQDATEVPYNGLDDDCDEMTLDDDLDQDGFGIAEDCDDENPLVNTDAEEIPNNGIDEDCDGEDLLIGTKDLLTIQPQISPNPTSNVTHLAFPRKIEGICEIRDINGKFVLTQQLEKDMTIDLSPQAAGLYILVIKTKEGIWTERILKL